MEWPCCLKGTDVRCTDDAEHMELVCARAQPIVEERTSVEGVIIQSLVEETNAPRHKKVGELLLPRTCAYQRAAIPRAIVPHATPFADKHGMARLVWDTRPMLIPHVWHVVGEIRGLEVRVWPMPINVWTQDELCVVTEGDWVTDVALHVLTPPATVGTAGAARQPTVRTDALDDYEPLGAGIEYRIA
jgi:hypothetical protein